MLKFAAIVLALASFMLGVFTSQIYVCHGDKVVIYNENDEVKYYGYIK